MPKSTYFADKANDTWHGGPVYTYPATTYFGLFTVSPTPAGPGAGEVTIGSGGYGRVGVANDGTHWNSSSGGSKTNKLVMDWGTCSAGGGWGTIVAIAEFDASTGGNMLTYGLLSTPRLVNNGDPFQVPVNGALFQES